MINNIINPNLSFLRNFLPTFRICKLQGGTRSGKTYAILQYLIELCYLYPNAGLEISIVRKTLPALKATAYKDFIQILESFGAYDPNCHNMSEMFYLLNGNKFDFFSLDQPQKVRGRKRHILFINEANELDIDSWRQLSFRTSHNIILDFNPSEPEHWLYELDTRADCKTIITTYKDNPHLTPGQIYEIESLKGVDDDYWNVFGLGQIGAGLRGRIYTHFQECNVEDVPLEYAPFYGLDFGFNDPLALIEIRHHNDTIWLNELIYSSGLINSDVSKFIKDNDIMGEIFADSAEPKSIKELRKAGANIYAADKGPDSIISGINRIKRMNVFYTARSINIKKEQLHYKWKLDVDGKPMDEPVDKHNHAMDAVRYGISGLGKESGFRAGVF